MYAQVTRAAPRITELREEPGFVGAFTLVDRRRDETMVIVLWETAEQASGAGDTSVWEVNARI